MRDYRKESNMLTQTQPDVRKREVPVAQTEPVRSGPTYSPPVDIVEQNDQLLLLADMPGVRSEDVDIHYERGSLTICGRVPPRQDPDKVHYLAQEYGVGDYGRTFQIGEGVDAGKISAELRDGVLTVHLPKAAALMPRRIAVTAGR
jgi:HSP20 family protein